MTQIQLRRGAAASWTSNNPILAIGEVGYETDTLRSKIGDGVTAWNSLAYWQSAASFVQTTSTTTAAGTTTLTVASTQVQVFTGSSTQTVRLPTTGIVAGQYYTIINQSSGAVTVQSSGSNTIATLASNATGMFYANTSTPTTAAHWIAEIAVAGKTLTANNSLTLAGTDGTTMTFPSTSGTVVTQGSALGTPASGTLTNCSGLPTSALILNGSARAVVSANEARSSNSWGDLTTTTDSVTITVGASGMALVAIAALFVPGTSAQALMSFLMSGSNTLSTPDSAYIVRAVSVYQGGGTYLLTGLTAGSTTFKLKYLSTTGTSNFEQRIISVIPL